LDFNRRIDEFRLLRDPATENIEKKHLMRQPQPPALVCFGGEGGEGPGLGGDTSGSLLVGKTKEQLVSARLREELATWPPKVEKAGIHDWGKEGSGKWWMTLRP